MSLRLVPVPVGTPVGQFGPWIELSAGTPAGLVAIAAVIRDVYQDSLQFGVGAAGMERTLAIWDFDRHTRQLRCLILNFGQRVVGRFATFTDPPVVGKIDAIVAEVMV